MKKIVLILIMVLFSCNNVKKNENNLNDKIKENKKDNLLVYEFLEVKETRKNFIENNKKYTNEYEVDNINIKIVDNLNVEDNYNLKQVYINDKLIFSTKSETWIFKPYYCVNSITKLLFFEEGDEGGTWGYNVLLLKGNNINVIGFLDVSSLQNSDLDKYISLQPENQFINFNFLEPEIYSEIEGGKIKSSEMNIKINTNTLKFIKNERKNIDSSVEHSKIISLGGKWTSNNCQNPIGINIDEDELVICVEPNIYYIHLIKINDESNKNIIKYKLKRMEGLGSKDVFSEAYMNDNAVVEIKILDNNKIEYNWLGFYNNISNQRRHTEQLIADENPAILYKCKKDTEK